MTATPVERPAERIGGWLLAPRAWLLVSLLGTLLVVARFSAVLLTPEMAAVLIVPYFKRSQRVKKTFVNP